MVDWALFWMILSVVAVLELSWVVLLTERQRRKERAERLAWKRKYFESEAKQ